MAMQRSTITLVGFKELDRKLKLLDKKVQKKVQSAMLKEVIKEVVQPAVLARVPVLTGTLRAAMSKVQGIIVKAKSKEKKKGTLAWKLQTPKREKLGLNADTDFYYPGWIEYKQKSFLRAGLLAVKKKVASRAASKLARLIKAEAKKPA